MTLNNIALTTGDVMTFEDFMSRINKYFVFMYDSPCWSDKNKANYSVSKHEIA